MRTLPIIALVLAPSAGAPAQAQHWSDPSVMAAANVTVHRSRPDVPGTFVNGPNDRRFDRRRHRGDIAVGYGWYGGDWARYNNRSWEPDSYNDWWHDRPDRAYPRWVSDNRRNCERPWYSGDILRC